MSSKGILECCAVTVLQMKSTGMKLTKPTKPTWLVLYEKMPRLAVLLLVNRTNLLYSVNFCVVLFLVFLLVVRRDFF